VLSNFAGIGQSNAYYLTPKAHGRIIALKYLSLNTIMALRSEIMAVRSEIVTGNHPRRPPFEHPSRTVRQGFWPKRDQ
jgi:hypothetical protein